MKVVLKSLVRADAVSSSWPALALIAGAGLLAAASETWAQTVAGNPNWGNLAQIGIGLAALAVMLRAGQRGWVLPWRSPLVTLGLAFAGCVAAGQVAGVAWPNSGDEVSYLFLADTLLQGRLWHAVPADSELFRSYHVVFRDGRLFSPYPPGWSMVVAPFRAAGLAWLAGPATALAGGVALWGALRRACPTPEAVNPLLALALLNPAVLFTGGSLFPQTMSWALLAGITWTQLADDAAPLAWRKLLIGALFGVLLLTRYDVFAFTLLAYAIDRLMLRRWRVLADAAVAMIGLLPFAVVLLAYNAAITGHPLQLTATWAQSLDDGTNAPMSLIQWLRRSLGHDMFWTAALAQYGGLPLLALAGVAQLARLRQRQLRFYDALLPAAMLFYSLQPYDGGHQYGPRYWLGVLPVAVLGIAGLVECDARLRLGPAAIAACRVAGMSLVFSATAFLGLAATTRIYLDTRRAVYSPPPVQLPAIVLIPSRDIRLWPWQLRSAKASSADFTRPPPDLDDQVLYGRLDVPDAVARACRIDGRVIYEWRLPGTLVQALCSPGGVRR